MSVQRRQVHFSGNVQGVGFRYTAVRVAAGFDVTGYVRNLPDGRVEVVAEGSAEQIDSFLASLADRMGHYIDNTTQQISSPRDDFNTFNILF